MRQEDMDLMIPSLSLSCLSLFAFVLRCDVDALFWFDKVVTQHSLSPSRQRGR